MVMLKTRLLNDWLGTSYSLDDVADMDELTFEVLMSLKRGLNPPKDKDARK